jgi:RNA polymerase sigma-54 factor
MSAGLTMQTAQRLEMSLSPQLIQSMELLQLPLMQLEQRIRQEQLENPALELPEIEGLDEDSDNGFTPPPGDGEDNPWPRPAGETGEPDADSRGSGIYPESEESAGIGHLDDFDYNWDDSHDDVSPARKWGGDEGESYDPIANAQAKPPSLLEHLLAQLTEIPLSPRPRALIVGMMQKLDANGWLTVPLEETVPDDLAPPAGKAELDSALGELQKLDPPGIGARNLSECLALQLRNLPGAPPAALAMARRHLEDLAANRLPKIAKSLKCGLAEVKRGAALIRGLNPRPGAGFAREPAMVIRPELKVEGDADSGFRVELVSGRAPRISDFFMAFFDHSRRGNLIRKRLESDPGRGPAFAAFKEQMRRSGLNRGFREKYNNAQWLVKAVAQRENTILEVADAVVKAQSGYLSGKQEVPSPLFMQDIAKRLGFDVSTVSRAVKDKYIDTPLGIKPLKHFFARGVAAETSEGAGKESQSSAAIMMRIKEMIEGEDGRRPLRDNEIMARLAAEGVAVKRRTIVNYREKMGFPSHSHRREH